MDSYDKIKAAAQAHRVKPDSRAWDRVERRLGHRAQESLQYKRKWKNKFYSIIVIAILSTGIAVIINESNNPTTLSSGQIASWEELEETSNDFYTLQNIKKLNSAYEALGINKG